MHSSSSSSREWIKGLVFILIVGTLAVLISPGLSDFFHPSEVKARRARALEASAVGGLRTLNAAQAAYAGAYPKVGFACSLADLGGNEAGTPDQHHAGLIDKVLASGQTRGYVLTLQGCTGKPAVAYTITAVPARPGQKDSGRRAFCTDQSGVIRVADDGRAETCLAQGRPL